MSNRNKEHSDDQGGHAEARHDHHHHHKSDPVDPTAADQARGGAAAESLEASPTIEGLQAQLAEQDREIAELKDKYMRTLAEFENARKRIRQQSEESVRLQRETLLRDLLPIVDNLERAVGAAQGGGNGQ